MPQGLRGAIFSGLAASALFLGGVSAKAQSVEDFYRGKTISMVVSSSPGGGYDALSRTLARHLGKHIPGNPVVVVYCGLVMRHRLAPVRPPFLIP